MGVLIITLKINEERFLNNFALSSAIGATKNHGLHRLALSDEDKKMRDQFVELLKRANLQVRIDDFGNIYGRREGRMKDAPAITFGSHLDTQPYGGRYDGVLGVLAGLEVMETLNDHDIVTDYPLEVINFTNEEGARFNPPILGSGAVTGRFSKDFVYNLKDSEGIRFEDALERINYKGAKENRLANVKCYLELHIEQAPTLDEENIDIGIVEGLYGLTRLNVKVKGASNHAGGARMQGRQDALLAACYMVIEANKVTNEIDNLRTTVGKINNYPNVINVIPGYVEFVVDIRHPQDELRKKATQQLSSNFETIAKMHNVSCETSIEWEYNMVPFDEDLNKAIENVAKKLNYSYMRLYGGPGHDAKYMSTYTPTALIFVKSVKGISHSEEELTYDEDLVKGANVLLHTVLSLSLKK